MSKFKDLTGMRFGRLFVIRIGDKIESKSGDKEFLWLCRCDCDGKEKLIRGKSLKSGKTTSCGCYHKEVAAKKFSEVNKKYNRYDLSGEFGIGYSTKGEEFYFDLDDYDLIKNYCWSTDKNKYFCAWNAEDKTIIKLHQLILSNKSIDHINGLEFDNRKKNLRLVTQSQNCMNRKTRQNTSSGVKGIYFNKQKQKWVANIFKDGKNIYLGSFILLEDAIREREIAEELYFGEFSFYNSRIKP
jgi:hypothetical protein